jgi:hypothetical protein
MKRIKSLSSAALRLGCSYYGLNPVLNNRDEIVFVFRSLSWCAFASYLLSHKIPFHTGCKNNFYSVYVPVLLLLVYGSKKILFKNMFQLFKSFFAFANFGYDKNWEVAEVNSLQRNQNAASLCSTQWGKKLWYENNLLQAR